MTDEFNPDAFDWGDGSPGIDLDDVGPDIVEQAVAAAMNAHEERFGWRYLKKSERKEGAGRLFRVKHYTPEEGKKFFEEEFPGYTFVWDTALGHHDHPVSHLCTELNELEMVEPLIEQGKQYIDLFGNYKRNRRYKRNCVTTYTMATPKDYIRANDIGQGAVVYDLEKMCDPNSTLGKIDDIACTHGLYYLTMEEIGRILSVRRTRRIRALVHRHKGTHGFLNAGEQEYHVSENLTVTQTNVSTGEKYVHPSLEALFHQGSAKTSSGGVAWTIRAAGGDSFHIELVGCPNDICEEYIPLRYLKPESWEQYTYNNVSVKKFLHWTWMSATTTMGTVRIEDTDLFSKLRRYVAGKQRTPRLKTETMNYARRLCNKLDIISIHGGGAHEIPVASMADYVEVAFHLDVRQELDAALSFHRENVKLVTALNAYYESGALPKDLTLVTGAACVSGKLFSDAAIAVINSVRRDMDNPDLYCLVGDLPPEDLERGKPTLGDPGPKGVRGWW